MDSRGLTVDRSNLPETYEVVLGVVDEDGATWGTPLEVELKPANIGTAYQPEPPIPGEEYSYITTEGIQFTHVPDLSKQGRYLSLMLRELRSLSRVFTLEQDGTYLCESHTGDIYMKVIRRMANKGK